MDHNVNLVIDALDECSEREQMIPILKRMLTWDFQHLRILIASRDEPDIRASLGSLFQSKLFIDGTLVAPDIRAHVLHALSVGKLNQWSATLKKQIQNTLTKEAHGMYV